MAISQTIERVTQASKISPTVDHDADQIKRLDQRIGLLQREGQEIFRQQLELAREAGEILTRKKASLGHGKWTPWLEANFGKTPRQFQKYMRLHAEWERIEPLLDGEEPPTSLNAALQAISTPQPKQLEPSIPSREAVIGLWEQVGDILYPTNGGKGFSVDCEAIAPGKLFTFKDHKLAWEKWNQVNGEGRPIGEHLLLVKTQKRTESSDSEAEPIEAEFVENPFRPEDVVWNHEKGYEAQVVGIDGDRVQLEGHQPVNHLDLDLVNRCQNTPEEPVTPVEVVTASGEGESSSGAQPDVVAIISDTDDTIGWGDINPDEDLVMPASHQPVDTLKSSSQDGDDNRATRNTPEYLWKPGLEMWGREAYDVDPMTNKDSTVPATVKYTKADDGLSMPWVIEGKPITLLFANSDYGLNKEFVAKLEAELATGQLEALVLNKHDHRSGWCKWLINNCTAMVLIDHGVKFEGVDSNGNPLEGSFFPSTIFYFGSLSQRFYDSHQHLGTVVVRYDQPRPDQSEPMF
jgi:hypothetical protein